MLRTPRSLVVAVVVGGSPCIASVASAQAITQNNSGLTDRIDSQGNTVTSQERPQNLNPTGVSYSDCIANQSLRFYVGLSGFVGQALEIWASTTADCSTDGSRGKAGTPPICWKVGEEGAMNVQTSTSANFDVRVQNIVGPQAAPPTTGALVSWGSSACYQQSSYASVLMNVWFVPVDSSGHLPSGAMATSFPVNTDLVGPPAPTGIGEAIGDTFLSINWTPNVDPDTIGYDLYVAQTASAAGAVTDSASGYTLVCSGDAANDATIDAAAAPVEASCAYVMNPTTPTGCGGSLFSQSALADGSGSVTVADDAGDDGSVSVSATGGGVSQIPTKYLVNANGTTTMTVSSPSVGSYPVKGLTNSAPYTVVVSAVDGFGNVGPPSAEVCATPLAVNDFYKVYRLAGGSAGGGFCTLEAVGAPTGASLASVGFGAIAFGLARRRRRRRHAP